MKLSNGTIPVFWLILCVAREILAWLPCSPLSWSCTSRATSRGGIRMTPKIQDSHEELTSIMEIPNDPSASRRFFLSSSLVAAGTILTSQGTEVWAVSSSSLASLPWVKDPINPKRSSLKIQDAETLGYNVEFVAYLTRFLFNFDPLAQQWWIDGASAIPKRSTQDEIFAIRKDQFSRFAASVELGLIQEFPGPEGPTRLLRSLLKRFCYSFDAAEVLPSSSSSSSLLSTTTTTLDAKQRRLLRERKEARRQLALLFGLLNDFQPTAEITKLLASVDNGSIVLVELSDDPTPRRGFGQDKQTQLPTLQLTAPQAGDSYIQAMAKPIMTLTGGLLRVDIIDDNNHRDDVVSFQKAPTIIISPPSQGGKAAEATALIKKGALVGIELTDPGEGYTADDQILVRVQTQDGLMIPSIKCRAVLEMEISAVEVTEAGNGYAVEKPIRLTVTRNDGTTDVIGYAYPRGPKGSFERYRNLSDNQVRTFERKLDNEVVEEAGDDVVSGKLSGGALPPLPFISKASSSQQLLSLLSEGFGLGYDKEKKRYYLTVDDEMVASMYSTSPTSIRLVPDFGPRGESPIERNMSLDLPTFLRLSFAGAICSSGVHLALTPLDVVKTKVQTNPLKYPSIGPSFLTVFKDEGPAGFYAGWLPTLTGHFVGGAVLYATTELLRRALTGAAGPAADSLEVAIILISAGISAAVGSIFACPFETIRIRSVAQPTFGSNAFQVLKRVVVEEGIGSLFNTIPVFLLKQVPYACVKFTVFDLSTEYLYKTFPAVQEDLKLSLLISLIGGIMGGVAGAFVSNPADAIISELKKTKSDLSPQDAFQVLLDRGGVATLFKGVPLRMTFLSLTASLQFLVYDGIRFSLGVGPDDLRLYMDVLGGVLQEKGSIV